MLSGRAFSFKRRVALSTSCLKLIQQNGVHFPIKTEAERQYDQSMPIKQYASQTKKYTNQRLFVFGSTMMGGLGIPHLIKPEKPSGQAFRCWNRPYRLKLPDFVKDVAVGHGFSLFALSGKQGSYLLGCGNTTHGQLGLQSTGPKTRLEYVLAPARVTLFNEFLFESTRIGQLAAGRLHCMLLTDNKIVTWGCNNHGQCGREISHDEDYAVSMSSHCISSDHVEKPVAIHCGLDHSLALSDSGSVYAWGWGADNQTGLGTTDTVHIPTKLSGDISNEHIIQITGRADTCFALSINGEIFGWGSSEYGQLGAISSTTQVPVPTHLPKFKNIKMVAAGATECAVLDSDGTVYTWGHESGLQPKFVLRPKDDPVISIKSGLHHFAAITKYGALYMWGLNKSGQLGLGHCRNITEPHPVKLRRILVDDVFCSIDHTVVVGKTII